MTPKEVTFQKLSSEKESALRAELELFGYKPSSVVGKDILVNMLMQVYFGGAKID